MTPHTARLREKSLAASPSISEERANLLTDFYQAYEGKFSVPVMWCDRSCISASTRHSTSAQMS